MIPVIHNVAANFEGTDLESATKKWQEMHAWCKDNCRDKFYGSPAWTNVWGFEDDEDATAFALRWA